MQGSVAIGRIVAAMDDERAAWRPEDGLGVFCDVYRQVTALAALRVTDGTFTDPAFVEDLDVRFASLFLDVPRDLAARREVSRAWAPLVERRSTRGIWPVQFALAGMNAHINRDLPVVLVATVGDDGRELRDGSDEHRDFLEVNGILAATEERVKPELLTGFLGLVDRWLGAADDAVALWNVARARDAAWSNARTLWALRGSPELAREFVLTLDRSTGLAGRGLLRPLPPVLRLLLDRLRRRFR